MPGSTFLEILTCLYLPIVEQGEMGKFFFQSYLIFISFYIYHFFFLYTRVSDNLCICYV
jgi:hypothetical protein